MSKYDFIQRVLLQRPSTGNIKQVFNHIQSHLGSIKTNVTLTTDPGSIRNAVSQVNNLNASLKKTKNLSDDFAGILANATRRFAGISIATGTMLSLVRGVKNAYKETLEFERQMKRVEIASGATTSQIKQLSNEVLNLGSAYGVSSLELGTNARLFAQAGFSAKTTSKALDILAKTNVAGTFGDMADTTEGIIAVLQQFRREVVMAGGETQFLEKTFDSIQNVSKKFAVEAEDIVVAIRKAGAAFESAGGSSDELIGVMTSLRSTTRESASTLANSIKTIFTRIQRPATIEFLKEMGVELVDMEGKFVGPIEAIERLASTLAVLDKGDVRYAQIADKIGGIYQVNRLLALLKNTTTTAQAIEASKSAEGTLTADAEKGLETTISKIERLKQSFLSLVKLFSESDSIKRMVDLFISMADSAITVTKSLEPLLPLLTSVLSLMAGKFAFSVAKNLVSIGKNPGSINTTQVGGYADGGRIRGGKPGIDTVPAMLDNGEFVVNRKDAAKNIGLLTAINNGRNIAKLAGGGPIGRGFNMNQFTATKAMAGSLDQNRYTKPKGEAFSSDKLFNYEDRFQININRVDVGPEFTESIKRHLKQSGVKSVSPNDETGGGLGQALFNYVNTKDLGTRGRMFEKLYSTINGIQSPLTDSQKQATSSRIDGFKGGTLYEMKSKGGVESDENIVDKFLGAATKPMSHIDRMVHAALSKKELTPNQDVIDFGENFNSFDVIQDKINGKINLNEVNAYLQDGAQKAISVDSGYGAKKIQEYQSLKRDGQMTMMGSLRRTLMNHDGAHKELPKPADQTYEGLVSLANKYGISGYAEGGRIRGGKPGIDTVPAMLDNGEFVVNRKDAAKNIGLLTAINNGRSVQKFQYGGFAINDFKDTRQYSKQLKSTFTKQEGEKFQQGFHFFNPKDTIKISDTVENIDLNQLFSNKKLTRQEKSNFQKYINGTALERGKAFENLVISAKRLEAANNKYSRFDAFGNNSLYEFKSISNDIDRENIASKIVGAMINPISQIDKKLQNEFTGKKLSQKADVIDLKNHPLVIGKDSTPNFQINKDVVKLANGGRIGGGRPGIDTVPAMLDNGEFVVNRKDAAKNIGLLTAINSGRKVEKFADGSAKAGNTINLDTQNTQGEVVRLVQARMIKTGEDFSKAFEVIMKKLSDSLKRELDLENTSPDFIGPITKDQQRAGRRVDKILPFMQVTKDQVFSGLTGDSLTKDPDHSAREKNANSTTLNKRQRKAERKIVFSEEYESLKEKNNFPDIASHRNNSGFSSVSTAEMSQATMQKFKLGPKNSTTTNIPGGPGGPNNPVDPKTSTSASSVVTQNQQVAKSTGAFNQNLLIGISALSMLASQTGILGGHFEKAAAGAAAMFTSVKLMGSFIQELGPAASGLKDQASALFKSKKATDLNANSAITGKVAEDAKTVSVIKGKAAEDAKASGGFGDKFGSAVTGIAIAAAIVQGISSYFDSMANDAIQKQEKDISRVREKGTSISEDDLRASAKKISDYQSQSQSAMLGGMGGIASGAALGAAIGSIVPGIGTAIGAAIGAVAVGATGAIVGASVPAMSGLEKATHSLTMAQYAAAKGAYDFDQAISNAQKSGLKGSDLENVTSEQLAKARKAFDDNKTIVDDVKSGLNETAYESFWKSIGMVGKDSFSSSGKETVSKSQASFDELQQNMAKAAQQDISAKKDNIIEMINSAESLDQLSSITENLGPRLEALRKSAYDSIVGSAEDKQKAADAEVKGTMQMIQKVSKAKADETIRTEALVKVKQLEIEAIKNTTSSMLALAGMADKLEASENAFEQFTTGSSKGVTSRTFGDLTKISNLDEFAKKARGVGSQIAGGDEAASNVIKTASFISAFRSGITGAMGESFKSIMSQKLDADTGKAAIFSELGRIKEFSSMAKDQQDAVVAIVQEELAQGKFSADSLYKAMNRVADVSKTYADQLGQAADAFNAQVDAIKKYNESLLVQQSQLAELRSAQIDIVSTGNNRIVEAMSRYANIGTDIQNINQRDVLRTQKSNIALQSAGIAPIAGDINSLSSVLSSLQSRKLQIDKMMESTTDATQRAGLNSENQKLIAQTKVVTDELGKLANQSDKAADIMTKLEKVRQLKDYTGGRVKDFISGGAQDRSRMMREVYGLQQVMQARNFNVLSDDLRGSVMKMMEERAKLDPTGQMQKIYDMSLKNAAMDFGMPKEWIQQAMGKPNDAEKQLINTLYDLNRKEFQAQQMLINAQNRNTEATLQLINQISLTMGQRINPALMQQPQMFNQGPMQNFRMNQNMMNNNMNNMQMQHQMNVNGQLNINGLNSDRIAREIVNQVTGYVVQQVNTQLHGRNRRFRAGN